MLDWMLCMAKYIKETNFNKRCYYHYCKICLFNGRKRNGQNQVNLTHFCHDANPLHKRIMKLNLVIVSQHKIIQGNQLSAKRIKQAVQ